MTTKLWKDKQTKPLNSKHQNAFQSVSENELIAYPEPSYGKPAYTENPDIPWVQSPQPKEQANDFVEALVHEIRNPLAVISLSAELMKNKREEDGDLEMYVDMIVKSTVKIKDLVNRFLAVQTFAEATENTCSVAAVFNEVLEIVADRIRLKNIAVIKDFHDADFVWISDLPKLKIALTNIITNAIEALPSVNGILRLAIKENNNHYSVRIEDNGCGISQHHLRSIFEKGFTGKPNGSGYGLSITNHFLQANGIIMKVKSEEGKGTIFLLLFN